MADTLMVRSPPSVVVYPFPSLLLPLSLSPSPQVSPPPLALADLMCKACHPVADKPRQF